MMFGVADLPTTRPAVSVLLAGHAPPRARALRAVLEAEAISVCAEAADLPSTIARAAQDRPDLCLLDAVLAGGGYTHVRTILEAARGVRVVILDGAAGDVELLDAVAVGAVGHLPRDIHAHKLTAALRDVLEGRPAFPRRLEALLISALYAR